MSLWKCGMPPNNNMKKLMINQWIFWYHIFRHFQTNPFESPYSFPVLSWRQKTRLFASKGQRAEEKTSKSWLHLSQHSPSVESRKWWGPRANIRQQPFHTWKSNGRMIIENAWECFTLHVQQMYHMCVKRNCTCLPTLIKYFACLHVPLGLLLPHSAAHPRPLRKTYM